MESCHDLIRRSSGFSGYERWRTHGLPDVARAWIGYLGRSFSLLSDGHGGHVTPLLHSDLVDALLSLPERQLVEVIALALEARKAEVGRPEWQSAKLVLAQAHRFNEASGTASPWELLVLARPQRHGEFVEEGYGLSQEGSCCGLTLVSYAKTIVCPICGKPASAT